MIPTYPGRTSQVYSTFQPFRSTVAWNFKKRLVSPSPYTRVARLAGWLFCSSTAAKASTLGDVLSPTVRGARPALIEGRDRSDLLYCHGLEWVPCPRILDCPPAWRMQGCSPALIAICTRAEREILRRYNTECAMFSAHY